MHGTPAKAKFFSSSLSTASPTASADQEAPQRERAAIGMGDGLLQLEQEEEAKHAKQFVRPSQLAKAAAISDPVASAEDAPPMFVERQRLLSSTSKHCSTCDKILVKLDPNPSNSALDVKNRIHVAAIFVLRVSLASFSKKESKVTLLVANPMKNAVMAELSPLNVKCRYTLAKAHAMTLAAAPGRAPVTTRVPALPVVATTEAHPSEKFGVIVTLRYEGVLGKQETRYNVYISEQPTPPQSK